jgi:hypothetical protein
VRIELVRIERRDAEEKRGARLHGEAGGRAEARADFAQQGAQPFEAGKGRLEPGALDEV